MAPMSSPARNPSPAEQDLQHILEVTRSKAEAHLSKTLTIAPFAIVMDAAGEIRQVAAENCRRHDSLIDQIEDLRQHLQAAAGSGGLKASAVAYIASVLDCESGQMQDAVAINLNHRDALSTVIYFPFELTDETPQWGPSFQQAGRSDIFQ
jgi:hypothetical protein